MTDANFTLFAFVQLGSRGDKAKLTRPSNGQVIPSELCRIAEMRIPAFPGADEQDAVSRAFNHVAVVVKLEREFLILGRDCGKDNIQIVIPARAAFLQGHAFVLKKLQRLAVLSSHTVYGQSAGQLKHEGAGLAG